MAAVTAAPLVLTALAHPHRWAIVSLLARGDRRVGELSDAVGQPQNVVSYHLRELRDAGLVSSRRSSHDGRDAYYRLDLDRCGALLQDTVRSLHPALGSAFGDSGADDARRRGSRSVLFLCTGNSARSQMAAALVEHRSGGAVRARSAGSHPKPLHPEAVRVMAERGIDISGNRTQHLDRYAARRFDAVITLCDKVREVCPDPTGDPLTSHWSLPDPATAADAPSAFREVAADLERRIDALLPLLTATQEGS